MTTKKPSAVAGLKRGLGGGQAEPAKTHDNVTTSPTKTKPIRITIDLDPARYAALNKWLATAAAEINPDARQVSKNRAVKAMIDAVTLDKSIGLVVIDLLRREGS